jgi:pimeloyl-ACP methyl ester carboxylesterase
MPQAYLPPYGNGTQPAGIRSRSVANVNGLTVHVLEAGYETAGPPAVLLLHGFPELAYSWRKVMLPLAHAGYHVIAPDQRGYGRTTAGTALTMPIPILFGSSTWCAMRWRWSLHLAIAMLRWSRGTTPARRSRPSARLFALMYFARS